VKASGEMKAGCGHGGRREMKYQSREEKHVMAINGEESGQ
jgi:hypothetical protein